MPLTCGLCQGPVRTKKPCWPWPSLTWDLHQHPLAMGPEAPFKLRTGLSVLVRAISSVYLPPAQLDLFCCCGLPWWSLDLTCGLTSHAWPWTCCITVTFSGDLDSWLTPVPFPGLSCSSQSGSVGLSPCYVTMLGSLSFRQQLSLAAPWQPIP